MKYRTLYNKVLPLALAAAVTIGFVSCGNSDMEMETAIETEYTAPLSISAVISSGGETRVDGLDAETFEEGDTIGLFILNSNGSAYGESDNSLNVAAVYNGSYWDILQDVYLSEENAKVFAYYPYNAEYGNNLPDDISSGIPISLLEGNNGQADLLTSGPTYVNSSNPESALYFYHQLTRVTLSIMVSDDNDEHILSSASVCSAEEDIENTIWVVIYQDSIISYETVSEDEYLTDAITVTADNDAILSSSEQLDIDILLCPCSASDKTLSLVVDDITYEVNLESSSISYWYEGEQYTYPIIVTVEEEDNADVSEETADTVYYNGYAAVDLGLSVMWATCNVGADSPEDYGNYYAWGETGTKRSYDSDNCSTFMKEIADIGGTSRDVAHVKWGGSWRMPTYAEIKELRDSCDYEWTAQNGVKGGKFTSKKNGNSIFLPGAGWRSGTSHVYTGSYGSYWSSTPYESDTQGAYDLGFNGVGRGTYWCSRDYGQSVRPVAE